ncbi:hypothetical protein MMC29_002808 [Sticta canariensis]|nr:hypothetical protein [Sticta canariensis]
MSMAGPRSLAESELQALWNDAESKFERLTTKKLRFHGPPKTLDDVIKEIENRKIDDDSSEGKRKREKMKKISQKVLKTVQLLAGIVAQGASSLYPPAGLCFNAVSFLVAVPGKVSKIYETIGELFDKISVCLSQFKIYERIEQYRRIDPALLSTIHNILASLVNICALSIKLLDGGKFEKTKQTFKVALFDEDPGTSAELRKLSLLAETQSAIAGSLTLESVLMNETKLTELLTIFGGLEQKLDSMGDGVSQIVAFEKDRKKEKILDEQLENIAKTFGLPGTVKKDTKEDTLKIQNEKINERLPGTGKWLDTVNKYTDWEDRDSLTATSVLLLIGEESFGKSILTSAIVSKLQARYRQGERASTRTYVAFYYFQKGSEKGGSEKGSENTRQKVLTVEYALKCMSYQLAYDDEVYRKDMESLCKSNTFDIGSADFVNLWKSLKLGSSKTDVTYFLIFDGIDQVEKKNLKQLLQILSALENSEEMGQLRLRIMLTGRKSAFEDESLEMASRISLGDYNKPDIEKYISQELDKMEALQGDDVERMDLRSNIKAKLPQKVGGDFSKVQTAFDAFKQAKFIEEISKILDGKDLDRKTYLKKEIEKCNKNLSSDDVEDLNELLAWVVYGLDFLKIAQLEAALLLRHDKTSLLPLESKLKKEYSIFFTIGSDGYVINNPECTELVTEEKENDDDEEDTSDMTSKQEADTQITAAEINMVDRFILQICGKEIYDRFGFLQFFERKGSHPAMIGVREPQAHLIIVKNCLKLLTSDEDKMTKSLALYAITYLPEHLSCAAKAKNIGSADKNFVQTKLLTLLTHESVIERCWQGSSSIIYYWDSQAMENVWHWMRDSVEVRKLYAAKDDWFRTTAWSEEPGMRLLKPIVRMMAKRWLQSRDFLIEETVCWVIEYVKETFDKAPADSESNDEAAISAAISWAQKELDVKEANSLWYERSGAAYFAGEQYKLAIKSFRQAKSMDPSNWIVDERLALTFAEYDDYADHYLAAIEAMETVLEAFRNNSNLGEEYPGRFVQNLQHQAVWHRELKNSDEAIKLYQEALSADESAYKCVYGLLSILESQDKIEEAQKLLIGMDRKPIDEHESTQLVAMHHKLALDDDRDKYFTTMFEIAKRGQIFERFRNTVQSAIDVAKRMKNENLEGVLLFHLGFAFAGEEQRRVDAVKRWQDCVTLALKPSLRDWDSNLAEAGYQAFHQLSSYYYKNAFKIKLEGGDPAIYLDRLDKLTESASAEETSYMTYILGFQEPRLLLGRYYALTGNVEKARVYFKKDMQSGLDLLSDEDPSNDWMGYLKLAETLMHFGDDLNALSAWSWFIPNDLKASPVEARKVNMPKQGGIDGKEDEDHKSEDNCMKSSDERSKAEEAQREATVVATHDNRISKTEDSGEEKHAEASEEAESDVKSKEVALKEENPENYPVVPGLKFEIPPTTVRVRSGDLHNRCDGRCNTRWLYADDMYCCKYCPDVQFDKACLDKLRAGTLNRHLCGADHEFLHVPKWSDDAFSEVGFGNFRVGGEMVDGVRVGGEVMEIEQWLDMLREEWGVSKPMKLETSVEV